MSRVHRFTALVAVAGTVAITGCGGSTSPHAGGLCTDTPPSVTTMHLCGAAARSWCHDVAGEVARAAGELATTAGQRSDAAKFKALAKRCDDIEAAR